MCSELLILGDPGPVGQELKKDDGCQVRHKITLQMEDKKRHSTY